MTRQNWLITAAVIGALFTIHSCNLNNMKRAYLGVEECVGYDPGARLDDASELEAWRRCGSEQGWDSWREVQRSSGGSDSGDP